MQILAIIYQILLFFYKLRSERDLKEHDVSEQKG